MDIQSYSATVSATDPDWNRERVRKFWDPGPKLVRAIRGWQAAKSRGGLIGLVLRRYRSLNHRWWSVLRQCDIPVTCQIMGGLYLPHPNGIVVHPSARIGPNCMIFQQVTLTGLVTVRGHVDVGAGAKLIGPLTVGDHVQIGANAVVTRDLPDLCVAAGVPAGVIARVDPAAPSGNPG
jgi:serine O-acetyltransferase